MEKQEYLLSRIYHYTFPPTSSLKCIYRSGNGIVNISQPRQSSVAGSLRLHTRSRYKWRSKCPAKPYLPINLPAHLLFKVNISIGKWFCQYVIAELAQRGRVLATSYTEQTQMEQQEYLLNRFYHYTSPPTSSLKCIYRQRNGIYCQYIIAQLAQRGRFLATSYTEQT